MTTNEDQLELEKRRQYVHDRLAQFADEIARMSTGDPLYEVMTQDMYAYKEVMTPWAMGQSDSSLALEGVIKAHESARLLALIYLRQINIEKQITQILGWGAVLWAVVVATAFFCFAALII